MLAEASPSETPGVDGPPFVRWISIKSMTNDGDNLVECPDCGKQFPAMMKITDGQS